jgi:isocitrate/isopropylmalate dehydrogenase
MRWLFQRTKVDAARAAAQMIEHAVGAAIRLGTVTTDLGGNATTATFTKAVINELKSAKALPA